MSDALESHFGATHTFSFRHTPFCASVLGGKDTARFNDAGNETNINDNVHLKSYHDDSNNDAGVAAYYMINNMTNNKSLKTGNVHSLSEVEASKK